MSYTHFFTPKFPDLQYVLHIYRIASNYGRSRINAWSHFMAGENSIIAKINAGSRINARSFVVSQ